MESPFTPVWEQVVFSNGENVALSDLKSQYTFSELNREIIKVASWLQNKGIRNECVIICLADKIDNVVALLGILLSGNHYFNVAPGSLNDYESSFPQLATSIVFVDNAIDLNSGNADRYVQISEVFASDLSHQYQRVEIDAKAPFAIFSTSGSTGQPKLVRHCHQYIMKDTLAQIASFAISPSDTRDFSGSLMFSAALGAVFPTLLAGAHLMLNSVSESGPMLLPDFWREKDISLTTVPVSVLRIIAKSGISLKGLARMRIIIISAEAASREDIELFADKLPAHIILMNGYASTETRGIALAEYHLSNPDTSSFGTLGKPWDGKRVTIESENGELLEAGKVGEIVVEAEMMPHEYLYNAMETSRVFASTPDGAIRFRTGDLGYFNEFGRLVLKGRNDSVGKINGMKVNLLETESCINSYPGIRESSVLLNKNQRIQAYFSVTDDFDLQVFKKEIRARLAPQLIPSGWYILDELPKTITGKTDRQALIALFESIDYPLDTESNFLEQDESILKLIISIWKKELEVNEIEPTDDFFKDLGGNSLLCAVCIHELEKKLNIQLSAGVAYTYTTPATLEEFIIRDKKEIVLRIKLNRHEADKPTLYFIPPYPGDRRTYNGLEEGLLHDYNLYFLYYNPISPDNNVVPFNELIMALTDAVEPGADITLLGYSFGGMLTYFVALKLEEQKRQVRRLVLLDTPTYQQFSRFERAYNFSVRILRRGKQLMVSPKEILQKYVINFKSTYKAYNDNFTSQKFIDEPLNPTRIIWNYVQSFPEHQVIKSDIILFRVSELTTAYQFKWDFGWQRYAVGKIKTIMLKGWHEHVLKDESNIKTITKELAELGTSSF